MAEKRKDQETSWIQMPVAFLIIAGLTSLLASCPNPASGNHGVRYEANGATAGRVPRDPNRYAQGQVVTVLDNIGGLARTPCKFACWNTRPDQGGTTSYGGSILTMGEADVTLYAIWGPYTVTYDGNGNTGGSVPIDDKGYTVISQGVASGNSGNLVKTGYAFAGWNSTSDGSGISYTEGSCSAEIPDRCLVGLENPPPLAVVMSVCWACSPALG